MSKGLRESIERLTEEDQRFPAEAYFLVFEGLERALARIPERRHVAPHELLAGVRIAAVAEYGCLAPQVLGGWNVLENGDVADVVFNLVKRKLLVANDSDTRAEFESACDLLDGLDATFLDELQREPPRLAAARN